MNVVLVVGNPKLHSRTRQAAELVARRLTGEAPADCVELAELGPALLTWGDPAVEAAKQRVLGASLAIVASPTFKATYTGLLKCFLDQFDAGAMAGTPAVALMVGGSERHALAGEHMLKPVLTEIGCSCPAPALFLLEADWDRSPVLEAWLPRAAAAHGLDLPAPPPA
ncbi:MAG TPA: NAD(P)H-dependent oxidoreductase [Acidimicrobiales bacterium]|nr:NAD(P)H-dependent oxidoreductase [Acidimicrobiales bacterium]